jgi:sugar phosphate isomerase/epimerase
MGIQLGWVQNDCKKDLEGTLKKLKGMGYGEVEAFSPFFGRTPREFRRILDACGLVCPSAHWMIANSEAEWEKQVEAANEIGLRYLFAVASVNTLDDCKRSIESMNKMGERCRRAGLQLGVHNHHREFRSFDGVVAYDMIVSGTDPQAVTFELDCFWCAFAGKDPVEFLGRYPGRFSLLHIKDLKPGYKPSLGKVEGQPFTEVGRGIINWKRIFAVAPRAGVKHYFVEQDICDRPPLESAKISAEFLKNLKI